MKRILTILLILSFFESTAQNANLSYDDKKTMSIIMIGGGVSLTLASSLTTLEWTRGANGIGYTKPFYENPAHFAGTLTGISVSFAGVFTLLSTSKKRH